MLLWAPGILWSISLNWFVFKQSWNSESNLSERKTLVSEGSVYHGCIINARYRPKNGAHSGLEELFSWHIYPKKDVSNFQVCFYVVQTTKYSQWCFCCWPHLGLPTFWSPFFIGSMKILQICCLFPVGSNEIGGWPFQMKHLKWNDVITQYVSKIYDNWSQPVAKRLTHTTMTYI